MFDEDILFDILVCLEDKTIEEKRIFLKENQEVLNFPYKNAKIKDYLIENDKDIEFILSSLQEEKDNSVNSEISNKLHKESKEKQYIDENMIKLKDNLNRISVSSRQKTGKVKENIVFKDPNYIDDNEFNLLGDINEDDDEDNNNKVVRRVNNSNNNSNSNISNSMKSNNKDNINDINKGEEGEEEYLNEFLKAEQEENEENMNININNINEDVFLNNNRGSILNSIKREAKIKETKIKSNDNLLLVKESPEVIENSLLINQKHKEDNKDREENIIYQPRFAVGMKLKRKNLDNSVDDYACFDYVDYSGFEEFKLIAKEYFIRKMKKKVKSIVEWYKNEISILFKEAEVQLNTDEIKKTMEFLNKQVLVDDKPDKKRGFFSCFSLKKERKFSILKDDSFNLEKEVRELVETLEKIRSELVEYRQRIEYNENSKYYMSEDDLESKKSNRSKQKLNQLNNINDLLDIEGLRAHLESKIEENYDLLFEEQGMNDYLKEEVDKYSEFFNIDQILHKQDKRIKMQTSKINQLEEFKILNECTICMDNERNVAFLPCLHFICCENCAFGLIKTECPQCHGSIETKRLIIN